MDYKRLYLSLFNAVTDAVEAIQQGELQRAEKLLISAQQKTEEIYMEDDPISSFWIIRQKGGNK